MNRDRIEFLSQLIPPGAPYLAQMPRDCSALGLPRKIDVYAHAGHDPQFGWNFVHAFLQADRPLPSEVHEPELLRAYSYARHNTQDPDVLAAMLLEHSANYQKRILMRCLLILQYDYSPIAEYLDLTEAACQIYEMLFWNVRHRSRIERIALVFPEGRQVEFLPGYAASQSLQSLALRAAMQHGLPAAEELLGLRNAPADGDLDQHAHKLMAQTLHTANLMREWGFEHQDLEIFSRALKVLKVIQFGANKRHPASTLATAASRDLSTAVRESLQRLIGTDRPFGLPADSPEALDRRGTEARSAEIDLGESDEPTDSHQANRECRFLRAA